MTCAVGAYSYAGLPATLTYVPGIVPAVNYALTCAVGAYTYSGIAAVLSPKHNYALVCAVGEYAYSGQAATLSAKHNYALSCANGGYEYAGLPATLTYSAGALPAVNYVLTCDAGAYAYSGNDATLLYSYNFSLVCETGAYVYEGIDAALNYYPGPQTAVPVKARRRRPIYKPRIESIVEKVNEQGIEEVQKTISRELVLQAQELASARTDYEIAKYMTQGASRSVQLAALEDKVFAAEERMAQIQDEEDFITILALTI